MQRFADTREFQVSLLQVIRNASQPNPSRFVLAEQLESMAKRLGAGKPRKKKQPVPAPAPVIKNIGQEEAKRLESLMFQISDSLSDVKREIGYVGDAIETLQSDAKMDERTLTNDEIQEAWYPDKYFASQILDPLRKGVDYLADMLEDHTRITHEDDLARAVRDFVKSLPKEGTWPKGKGEKHFHDVIQALETAHSKVPSGLTKSSDLGKLRQCFEAIADVVKLVSGKSVSVPKIPNALDDEDPRQLGFGFAASRRVANATELVQRLDEIWRLASEEHPSRRELAAALYTTAQALRPRADGRQSRRERFR